MTRSISIQHSAGTPRIFHMEIRDGLQFKARANGAMPSINAIARVSPLVAMARNIITKHGIVKHEKLGDGITECVDNLTMNLGNQIKAARNQRQISQERLQELCGWGPGSSRIGNYETNAREPTLLDLRLMAEKLNVSLYELLEEPIPIRVSEGHGHYSANPVIGADFDGWKKVISGVFKNVRRKAAHISPDAFAGLCVFAYETVRDTGTPPADAAISRLVETILQRGSDGSNERDDGNGR